MQTVIIVIHLMLVVAMIGVVLLQKSEGGGLVGSTGGFLTSRGTANVLTRTTALLAIGFFLTSLMLSWLAGYERKPTSILSPGGAPVTQPAAPGAPAPPLGQSGRGVLDTLRGNEQRAPGPAPGGPQVPQSQ
jgi:preprotein translocase subunit SecG